MRPVFNVAEVYSFMFRRIYVYIYIYICVYPPVFVYMQHQSYLPTITLPEVTFDRVAPNPHNNKPTMTRMDMTVFWGMYPDECFRKTLSCWRYPGDPILDIVSWWQHCQDSVPYTVSRWLYHWFIERQPQPIQMAWFPDTVTEALNESQATLYTIVYVHVTSLCAYTVYSFIKARRVQTYT